MATLHIHPTAINPADIRELQARTGLVAVAHGHRANLVSIGEFANRRRKAQPQTNGQRFTHDDGPSAA